MDSYARTESSPFKLALSAPGGAEFMTLRQADQVSALVGVSAFSPAHGMLGGSGFFFLQIHLVIVTTLSVSDANKQCGCKVCCRLKVRSHSETQSLPTAWIFRFRFRPRRNTFGC
jgi:hypothetical protein